jgi:hypothetical protein
MLPRPDRIIVPQYTAPKNLSLIAAAELLGDGKRAAAAQVIDLAVRKVIAITRTKRGFTLTRQGEAAGTDEQEFLQQFFGRASTVRLARGRNRELGQRLRTSQRDAIARLVASGLAAEVPLWRKILVPWRKQPVEPTALAAPIVDHLWGVHDYVKLAEQDRFRVLQSPEGALRNELDVLLLNEKLLPYAVLFGLEKQWMRELSVQYRDLPVEFTDQLNELLVIVDAAGLAFDLVSAVAEISTLVDATDALEGVGAVFGGIGEALSNLELPDLG